MGLTDRDLAILDFEASWWQYEGPKADRIRAELGVSPTHYYQLLNQLLDSPEAVAHQPLVVRRLRKERRNRRRVRFEGPSASLPPGR